MSKQLSVIDEVTGIWITKSPSQLIFSEIEDDELELFADIEIRKEGRKFTKVRLFANEESDPSQPFLGRLRFKNEPLEKIQDGRKEIGDYLVNEFGVISLTIDDKVIAKGLTNEIFLDYIDYL